MIERVSISKWPWLEKKLNEIIDAANALTSLTTVNPSGGKITMGDKNAVLDLGGGNGNNSKLVSDVTWDSTAGALVVTYSDASTTNITFSDCP